MSIVVLMVFICSQTTIAVSQTKSLQDGRYQGKTTCTCCGKYANQPGRDHIITVKNTSKDHVSFLNMGFQNREIDSQLKEGVLVIDDRGKKIEGLCFWGSVEILNSTEFKMDVEWSDPSYPDPKKVLNHCIGTFKKLQ